MTSFFRIPTWESHEGPVPQQLSFSLVDTYMSLGLRTLTILSNTAQIITHGTKRVNRLLSFVESQSRIVQQRPSTSETFLLKVLAYLINTCTVTWNQKTNTNYHPWDWETQQTLWVGNWWSHYVESLQENPTKAQYLQKIPKPTEGAYTRIIQLPFPTLDTDKVADVIEDGLAKAVSTLTFFFLSKRVLCIK